MVKPADLRVLLEASEDQRRSSEIPMQGLAKICYFPAVRHPPLLGNVRPASRIHQCSVLACDPPVPPKLARSVCHSVGEYP